MPLGWLRIAAVPRGTPRRRDPLGAWLVVIVFSATVTAADRETAHVLLLRSHDRAAVVIELAEDTSAPTTIEAFDDLSLTVQIGPVRGKVVDQVLRAAQSSPLVGQIHVQGVTRRSEGTLIAVRVTGKSAISGSVRQVGRRLYIDLEPLVSPRAVANHRVERAPQRGTAGALHRNRKRPNPDAECGPD